MAVRFVAVGELLVDVVAEGSGHDARIRLSPAGSAFNAAVAAAAAGAEATVIGTVGDDPGGRMILAELAARGVRAEVTVAERADRARSCSRTARSASTAGWRTTSSCPERIEADAVLVSGYVPAAAEALARARRGLGRARRGPPRRAAAGRQCRVRERAAARRRTRLAEGRRLAVVTHGAARRR